MVLVVVVVVVVAVAVVAVAVVAVVAVAFVMMLVVDDHVVAIVAVVFSVTVVVAVVYSTFLDIIALSRTTQSLSLVRWAITGACRGSLFKIAGRLHAWSGSVLEGSWGSYLIWVVVIVTLLITPLITTHEPLRTDLGCCGEWVVAVLSEAPQGYGVTGLRLWAVGFGSRSFAAVAAGWLSRLPNGCLRGSRV